MNKITLISCVSKKQSIRSVASKLYTSSLFKFNLRYAQKIHSDKIFILSAKYGLITLDEEIEPYDITLNNMRASERENWAEMVVEKLRGLANLHKDRFVLLAGVRYREHLLPHFNSYEIPMKGLKIGQQLQFLKRQLENE